MFWTRLLQHLKRSHVRQLFEKQWPDLRERFLRELRASPATPGTAWLEVEWITDPVIFVRHDRVEPHYALVGVSAICSGAAGDVQARSEAGTAVFHFSGGVWSTTGQLLLHLTPSEALEKLMHQFMQPGN